MKSKANIKGHPIHPMLVMFPIAFFTGALIFDVLALAYHKDSFSTTALYLVTAGIGSGLVAAVPGLIDFIFTVPPKSSGKKRAAQHGLTNTVMILVFGAALFYRLRAATVSPFVLIGLEVIGEALLFVAGWMGGTLVYRNQIGVDIRYADAGKWKEEHLSATDGQVEINDIASIKLNQMRLINVDGKRLVITKTEDGYAAFDDYCSHKGGSLAGGSMICGTVQCPWHGSQFEVKTGSVKAGPAKKKISTYPVKEEHGKLYVRLS